MTIYNYIEFFFVILFFLEIRGKQSEYRRLMFFYLESFVVIFILAFRNYDVGADSILYTNYYSNPNTYFGKMPWGFESFCNFLKLFSEQWQFFIFVTSIISVIPFLYLVKKKSSIVSFSFLSFLLCWDLLWLLETPIKQTTAITFFFGGYLLLINNNPQHIWIRKTLALGIIVFSVLIHSTIVLAILVLIILHYVSFTKKKAILSIIISVVLSSSIIVIIPSLYNKLEVYTMAFQLFDNVQNYTEDIATGLMTYDIKKILLPSLYVILVLLMCSEEEAKSLPAKCLIVGTIIFNLFIAFPNIPRVVLPFTLIGTALCPKNYRQYLRTSNASMNYVYLHILMLFMFIYLHIKKCMNFTTDMEADILPYSFWF